MSCLMDEKTFCVAVHRKTKLLKFVQAKCSGSSQVRLLRSWARHLTGRPHLYVEDVQVFLLKRGLVAGRASDCKTNAMS